MDESSNRIRELAYEIWQEQGCPDGQAEEHWLAAEREILSGGEPPLMTESELGKVDAPKTALAAQPALVKKSKRVVRTKSPQPAWGLTRASRGFSNTQAPATGSGTRVDVI
jgi:hypothetical protein